MLVQLSLSLTFAAPCPRRAPQYDDEDVYYEVDGNGGVYDGDAGGGRAAAAERRPRTKARGVAQSFLGFNGGGEDVR